MMIKSNKKRAGKSEWAVLSIASVLLFMIGFIAYTLLDPSTQYDPSVDRALGMIIGTLLTLLTTCVHYMVGSSRGSKSKDEEMFKRMSE